MYKPVAAVGKIVGIKKKCVLIVLLEKLGPDHHVDVRPLDLPGIRE